MKKIELSKTLRGIILMLILLLSGFLRLRGIDWDENYHLHPDERFLTLVETSITPVDSIRDYFDTDTSTLNPHNVGKTFYVYGTFPLFVVRYVAELVGETGYSQVYLVGRYLSVFFEIGVVLLVYLIAQKLFNKPFVSLLSALFYGLASLPIQQAHFFTVDTFTNFFITASFYVAVCIFSSKQEQTENLLRSRDFWNHILFGVLIGLAAASKVNAIVAALLLPTAGILRDFHKWKTSSAERKCLFQFWLAAAVVCLLTFRIFQPYAFQGPGFFGVLPNPKWIANLRELSVLGSGDINYPPSLQWARRPTGFAWQNLVTWGFGLPIGIPAIVGLVGMAWKIIKGEGRNYWLLLGWVILYGGWQSAVWNPTMRYLLFIYPMLAISAAWVLETVVGKIFMTKKTLMKALAIVMVTMMLVSSAAWAFSFSAIYTHPVTRVAATEWIYKNVEGPINLLVTGTEGDFSQPLAYPHYSDVTGENPLVFRFVASQSGSIQFLTIDKIQNYEPDITGQAINVTLYEVVDGNYQFVQDVNLSLDAWDEFGQIASQTIVFDAMPVLQEGKEYALGIIPTGQAVSLRFFGFITAQTMNAGQSVSQAIYECAPSLSQMGVYDIQFTPFENSVLKGVSFFRVMDWSGIDQNHEIVVTLRAMDDPDTILAQTSLTNTFTQKKDFRGSDYSVNFENPQLLAGGKSYRLTLEVTDRTGYLAIYGSKRLSESSWDDGLPLNMYGYNPYDATSGVYYSDLNLELYWDDNDAKLERFYTSLEKADYIYITSNRQWGSTTQIPESYPLTMEYYRALIGCPREEDLQDCYRDAQVGTYSGELGFELIEVFQSEPEIAGITINTQYAEEAFTVYDHPKVFILKKTDSFDMDTVRSVLGKVDLQKVVTLTPAQASKTPGDLTLSFAGKQTQQNGGTWADLFSRDSIFNVNQGLGLLLWYGVLFILGVVVYPTTRIIFKGLKDKGYAFSRLFGLLLLAFCVWILGSASIPVERWLITVVFLALSAVNFWLFWKDREQIKTEVKGNQKYILQLELVFLAFFVFFILVRLGNPDLWHAYKGGEKPMDFAYFNAIIKSTTYPPYDPWYAGGYINYYYFGSLMAGIFTKWLGIIPSIAYNFTLATFFAFAGSAAFGIGWNIQNRRISGKKGTASTISPTVSGLIFAVAVLIIGNLGTIDMLLDGFKQVAINAGMGSGNGMISTIVLWVRGFGEVIKGANFTYYPGDWYWIPSRTIPGEAITEFPYFTFLYADPHAHLFAYPMTLMAIGFFLAILLRDDGAESHKDWQWIVTLLGGSLLVGALAATNTWDYPVQVLLGVLAIGYEHFHHKRSYKLVLPNSSAKTRVLISFILSAGIFIGCSYLLFLPYHSSYAAGYTSLHVWEGTHTPLSSFFVHWGIFLFFIVTWMIIKTRDWLAATPISFVNKIRPYRSLLIVGVFLILAIMVWLVMRGVSIAIFLIPLLLWTLLLLFDKKQPLLERVILLFMLAGFAMILMVEVIVLSGDVGRMNTVFKFYLQAWTFLSISAAFGFIDLSQRVNQSTPSGWKTTWRVIGSILIGCGLLFPVFATVDKVTDRISDDVPLTLDGMEFMQTSEYWQDGITMDLEQDYQAIKWMQDNVEGSPVIVEGNVSLYQWGNRYSIYTGLPAVIGWDWHQRQQKQTLPSNWVTDRITEVEQFYNTSDVETARSFLEKYNVQYIVLGQLEQIIYAQDGLEKFNTYEGIYWQTVFSYQDTFILKVMD
ncbi:MAG TPA: hypothetical protein DCK95_08775 [Anaerolineaceae bacterium]|nr:hypothetical protein [Anaerolineaceae bacterium]